MGPPTVLVTSVQRADRPADTMEMLVVTDDGAWNVQTPNPPLKANGSGDVTSALFTAHLLATDAATALGWTAASVFALLDATQRSGERELRPVECSCRCSSTPTHQLRGAADPMRLLASLAAARRRHGLRCVVDR